MPSQSSGRRSVRVGSGDAKSLDVRRHARFVVSLPVQCTRLSSRPAPTVRGRTADISGGGVAVELPARLPPGTRVALEIRTGIGPLRIEADVLWTRRNRDCPQTVRHGLCLAGRSELLDLPVNVLLGQWLRRRARRGVKTGARGA